MHRLVILIGDIEKFLDIPVLINMFKLYVGKDHHVVLRAVLFLEFLVQK